MANTGKTVATLLIGAAIGAAVGYILATDKDTRQENMERIKEEYRVQGNPVMSMDVKKKELIGNFYRPGKL